MRINNRLDRRYEIGNGRRPSSLSGLPELQPHGGSIYVIEFSTGTIKVGKATDVQARLRQHEKEAARGGFSVVRGWVSLWHVGTYDSAERELIAWAKKHAAGRAGVWTGRKP